MLDVVVFPQVITVSVLAFQADGADGTGESKVLSRRLIISRHKALMHDVGKLEVLLRQEGGARGKKPAQVLERQHARACAWDMDPGMVFPVERLDELEERLTLLRRYRKNLGDDDATILVSSSAGRRDARVRLVVVQVLATLGHHGGSQGFRRRWRFAVGDSRGSFRGRGG